MPQTAERRHPLRAGNTLSRDPSQAQASSGACRSAPRTAMSTIAGIVRAANDILAMKTFSLHDRVSVSSLGGWKSTFLGTVCSGADPIQTMKGPEAFYLVQFDEPQQDISGPDLYEKAQVLSCYLDRADE